jgi:hypothetical protein
MGSVNGRYWIQGDCVQERLQQVTSVFLSPKSLSWLSKHEPGVQFVPARVQHSHQHPILHLGRERAESLAIEYIRRHNPLAIILDVGGNPLRHHSKQRQLIHSCCPVLSAADAVRQTRYSQLGGGWCKHRVQECACVAADAAIAVDVLYYLTPVDVANCCARMATRTMVAVVHDFSSAYGSFAGGEAVYTVDTPGTVSMEVQGNSFAYRHSDLAWLRASTGVVVGSYPSYQTLCWHRVETTATHCIYVFTLVDGVLQVESGMSREFDAAAQDSDYYGEVSVSGALNERAKISVDGEAFNWSKVKMYSFGPILAVFRHSNSTAMLCPKGLVGELSLYMMGKIRDADSFKALLSHARYKAAAYNLPPSRVADACFASCCLAFVRSVAHETETMYSLIEPLLPELQVHRDALQLQFKHVWKPWQVAACVGGAAVAAIAAVAAVGLGPAAAAGAVVGTTLASLTQGVQDGKDPFTRYRADRSSNPPSTSVVHVPNQRLPATDPPKSPDELLALPKDVSAKLTLTDPTQRKETQPLSVSGIVMTQCIPIVPSNSAHSSWAAIIGRGVKAQPYSSGGFDLSYFQLFERWVNRWYDSLFPGLRAGPVRAASFEAWSSRFPTSQRCVLARARERLRTGFVPRTGKRGMFVKIEPLMKSTQHGVDDFTPRMIQSSTAEHSVRTGPFAYAFSKRLVDMWDGENFPICYAATRNGERLGHLMHHAAIEAGEACADEGDYARYDTTIHERLLNLEAHVYQLAGATRDAATAFAEDVYTEGEDKWGNKYCVRGTRSSGRQNTSCGNSVLQGLVKTFNIAVTHCELVEADVMDVDPIDILDSHRVKVFVMGDDGLEIGTSFLDKVPQTELNALLGLVLERQTHRGPDAMMKCSFLSCRLWPVEGGDWVLAPKIGRVLAKFGYYVNPPPNIDEARLVRADILSRWKDCCFVPFLSELMSRCLALTGSAKPFYTPDMKRSRLHNPSVAFEHKPSAETYRMLGIVYGLTRSHEAVYASLLSRAHALPCVVDYAVLSRVMEIDGVKPDDDGWLEVVGTAVDSCPKSLPSAVSSLSLHNSFSPLEIDDCSCDSEDLPVHAVKAAPPRRVDLRVHFSADDDDEKYSLC